MSKADNTKFAVDEIYESLKTKFELFSDPSGALYATFKINGKPETVPTHDSKFHRSVTRIIHRQTGKAPLRGKVNSYISLLEDIALCGPVKKVWIRYAFENNTVYIDTANEAGSVIKITAAGPSIITYEECPVVFYRTKRTLPLSMPDFEGTIEDVFSFFQLESAGHNVLLISSMLKAMIPTGATPLICINGGQGSGKSLVTRFIKDLIDPTSPSISGMPSTERNFFISAMNSYSLAYDNLSCVSKQMCDILCTVITGAGYSTRKLHTDTDEIIFDGRRFIILNGIPIVITNPDICERSFFLEMASIAPNHRVPERVLMQSWEQAKPRILGGFYKAVSEALRSIDNVKSDSYHRMADFQQWVTAAIPALPFSEAEFHWALEQNRKQINDEAIEADPVASAVVDLIDQYSQWTGTATELLQRLAFFTTADVKRTHDWPTRPNKLTEKLRRAAVFLSERSIIIEFHKSGNRNINIFSVAQPIIPIAPTPPATAEQIYQE